MKLLNKKLQCLPHAHLINIGQSATFNTELNKVLKENGFHEMKFPDNPPLGDTLEISKMFQKTTDEEPSCRGTGRRNGTTYPYR